MHVPGEAADWQQGAVIYSYNNIDTYRFVEPKVATVAKDEPLVNWGWLGIGLGGVLVMVVVMFLLTRLYRRRQDEELADRRRANLRERRR